MAEWPTTPRHDYDSLKKGLAAEAMARRANLDHQVSQKSKRFVG